MKLTVFICLSAVATLAGRATAGFSAPSVTKARPASAKPAEKVRRSLPKAEALAKVGDRPTDWQALQSLRVEPGVAYIHGVGNTHVLLFTAVFADGSERDVTEQVTVEFDVPGLVRQISPGIFQSQKVGIAKLRARLAGQQAEGVVIIQPKRNVRVDFATDVAPTFSKYGCNNTNCHGALNGQNGFKLSLFGYDPDADYLAVVEHSGGRRINLQEPQKSLILLKPTFETSHGGGHLLNKDSREYRLLLDWIKSGVPKSAAGSLRLTRLEIFAKGFRVLKGLETDQQIVVVGHYTDGSQEDITPRVQYTTSRDEIVQVSPLGRVAAKGYGEANIMIRSLGHVAAVPIGVARPDAVPKPSIEPANFIDELIFKKLAVMNIELSDPASDEEFLRRVYLDVTGVLPSAEEARRFLADRSPDKRARLIDEVLERPEYADFWALKWADLFASNVLTVSDGVSYLQDWLRRAFAENKPYDQFVREVLTSRGSTWGSGAVNYYSRTLEDLTTVTAQVFLGLSIECARCHDHPSAKWKRDDFIGMTAFFSQLSGKGMRPPPVEALRTLDFDNEYLHPETRQVVKPRFLDGMEPIIRPLVDRRKVLGDWITSPDNPWFARATVNRIWRQLMGRGLVEPVDDFRETNPPTHPELLDRLAEDFVQHKFDLKHLMRRILNSKTYQLSSVPKAGNRTDELNYSRYYMRRLTAEQLLDTIVQVTGVPEKFLAYYAGTRAVNLADPGVPSSFLDMYDRPKRDAAKCERTEQVSLGQALNMLAGETINPKIGSEKGTLVRLINEEKSDDEIVEHFYLSALSRYPKAEEIKWCQDLIARAETRKEGLQNVVWALLNSNQFLFNH